MAKITNIGDYLKHTEKEKGKKKYTYEEVKKIFDTCSNDSILIDNVFNQIVTNVEEDWVLEFVIRRLYLLRTKKLDISSYLKKDYGVLESKENTLSLFLEERTAKILNLVNETLEEEKKENGELPIELGTGFILINNHFEYSKVIRDYFAILFIRKIFSDINLEEYLHNNFTNFKDFEYQKNGCKNFVINYISSIDSVLSAYVINNPYVLDEILVALDYIKKNWDWYTTIDDTKTIPGQLINTLK